MSKHTTRESWLTEGMKLLTPLFSAVGKKVPAKIRVSCGFPSTNALSNKKRRIGECWADEASLGKYFEIFITPIISDPVEVLDILSHELVHAVVGLKCGHKGDFAVVAKAIGLEGKMTSAGAGETLKAKLKQIAKQLGPYPHDQLSKMTTNRKKDTCRLLKAECPDCGYTVRITRKWIEIGLPVCPCGEEMTTDCE